MKKSICLFVFVALNFSCGPFSVNLSRDNEDILSFGSAMKFIRGGTYIKGTNDTSAFLGRSLPHVVAVEDFYIDSTEVTQKEFKKLMGYNPSFQKNENLDFPVANVMWIEAVLYCNERSKKEKRDTVYKYSMVNYAPYQEELVNLEIDKNCNGYRLPTDNEWEYACRAGTSTEYFWGDQFDSAYCWYSGNSKDSIHQVATKKPNAWNLYDMVGNLDEWCNDKPGVDSFEIWPEGLDSTCFYNSRICRGKSFSSGKEALKSKWIDQTFLNCRWDNFGFRCARNR